MAHRPRRPTRLGGDAYCATAGGATTGRRRAFHALSEVLRVSRKTVAARVGTPYLWSPRTQKCELCSRFMKAFRLPAFYHPCRPVRLGLTVLANTEQRRVCVASGGGGGRESANTWYL